MKFVMQRNRVIVGLGHAIEFQKDVPTYVPPELRKLVYESGGEPAGEEMPEEPVQKGPIEPGTAEERSEQLAEAVAALVDAGDRKAFTAGGAPHIKALAELLGWTPSTEERDQAWLAYQAEK